MSLSGGVVGYFGESKWWYSCILCLASLVVYMDIFVSLSGVVVLIFGESQW